MPAAQAEAHGWVCPRGVPEFLKLYAVALAVTILVYWKWLDALNGVVHVVLTVVYILNRTLHHPPRDPGTGRVAAQSNTVTLCAACCGLYALSRTINDTTPQPLGNVIHGVMNILIVDVLALNVLWSANGPERRVRSGTGIQQGWRAIRSLTDSNFRLCVMGVIGLVNVYVAGHTAGVLLVPGTRQ